ncbi:MAG TPA: secondary thiamine-phosphate synthase enzyme YjbQ [Syntrophorhabdaceae bacterium]|nr:secondary thiamine-phosphate synthase enzyme YjbQ [Syntrophorhabdaceae bacterium]
MKIVNEHREFSTKGSGDLIDITGDIIRALSNSNLATGSILVFVQGSTAGITTFEYEPGLISDVKEFHERMVPSDRSYHHDETWGDANGFSHLRAALTGQSFTVPFESGRPLLGTWQQVVLAEFDNRPRKRLVIIQMMGE